MRCKVGYDGKIVSIPISTLVYSDVIYNFVRSESQQNNAGWRYAFKLFARATNVSPSATAAATVEAPASTPSDVLASAAGQTKKKRKR